LIGVGDIDWGNTNWSCRVDNDMGSDCSGTDYTILLTVTPILEGNVIKAPGWKLVPVKVRS